jgi:hypothetical protein
MTTLIQSTIRDLITVEFLARYMDNNPESIILDIAQEIAIAQGEIEATLLSFPGNEEERPTLGCYPAWEINDEKLSECGFGYLDVFSKLRLCLLAGELASEGYQADLIESAAATLGFKQEVKDDDN